MENRLCSLITQSPSMANLRFKLLRILHHHEETKSAFQQLKSQIKISLLEAEDVFNSLAIPLIRLVGLKTEEMAKEGRSSSIIVEHDSQKGFERSFSDSEKVETSPFTGERGHQLQKSKEESYSSQAAKACEDLVEKQRLQLHQLVHLLRRIETQVNSCQNTILQSLEDHRHALHKFFQKAIYSLSQLHQQSQGRGPTLLIALKLLQLTFEHVGSVLGAVEDNVDDLVRQLAEQMCAPMAAHVKGLKAEMTGGASTLLVRMVKEMERMVRDRGFELEEARKKARVEEEVKLEAVRRLLEFEEKLKAMKEFVGLYVEAKRRMGDADMANKLWHVKEDKKTLENRLMTNTLPEKEPTGFHISPKSPLTDNGIKFNQKHHQLKDSISARSPSYSKCHAASPQLIVPNRRPITRRSYSRGLVLETPCPNYLPSLGVSPSSINPHVGFSRKRCSPSLSFRKRPWWS